MKNTHLNLMGCDEREFEKIVKENGKIITSIIKNLELECGHFKLSHEDLYQEGLIALHNAYLNYDEKLDAKFSTFAYMVINRSLHRFYYQQMNRYKYETYSLDNTDLFDYNSVVGDYEAGDHGIRYMIEDRRNRIDKLFTILNLEDQNIVALRANQNTYKQIAEKLNITVKRVDNRLRRIKDRFIRNNANLSFE